MSTRAIQDPMQLLGFRDPVTDDVLAGGSVEFYGAGGSVAKNAWEDKDKVTPITSVTLDSAGQAQVYLDGVYKFIVKNAAGTTKYTLDNLKFQARNTSTVTKTTDYQATSDDDYILVNTDSGSVTITLAAVAGVVAPITIKNIGTSGNSVTVDGSGAETIDGATTAMLIDDASQQYVTDNTQWYGAGIATGTTYTSTTLSDDSATNNTIDFTVGTPTVVSLGVGAAGTHLTQAVDNSLAVNETSTTQKGVIETAIQSEMEAETAGLAVTPDVQQHHPSACVAWVNFNGTGTPTIRDSYNVASIIDNGTGNYSVTLTNDMADTNYCVICSANIATGTGNPTYICSLAHAVGSVTVNVFNSTPVLVDAANINVAIYGLLA